MNNSLSYAGRMPTHTSEKRISNDRAVTTKAQMMCVKCQKDKPQKGATRRMGFFFCAECK